MEWIEEAKKEEELHREVLSFTDYMDYFGENAHKQLRPSYEYLIDMMKHFGISENGQYNIFTTFHNDSPRVFGQINAQKELFQNLINFQEEGLNNKFILLVGPNGSSKSSIVRKFMKGAEEYSKTSEGSLYSFSWVFPIDNYIKGSLGLSNNIHTQELKSFSYLEDKEISAILPSELRDHPILLIPLKYRQQIIEDKISNNKPLLDSVKKSYLYRGDLSKRNRMVYDALLKNYKGDHNEVLKHIRVEKFTISKRYSTGAATIEPQIHVDANMQQITMDKRLASLPPSLQSLNLFQMQGEVVMANRGILEFSDLLKRPLDTYKYLLQTMETANVNIQGILTELDIFFIGTSNEIHLAAFKQHPDYNSFKGRINLVRVPYLLNYDFEEEIYNEQIQGLTDKTIFEPHALNSLCLFAIMSRLRCCQNKNYTDKNLSKIAAELNPLQKAMLLSEESIIPDHLDVEAKQILKQGLSEIKSEFENENLYEGKFGLSPRDIKKILYDLSTISQNITFVETLDYLKKLITRKNEYDFLNMTPQGDFHHPTRFISLLKVFCLDTFDRELRDCLGLVDHRSYEGYIRKYISNINALIKGEKIKNEITGKFEGHDDYFIKEFEKNINLKEDTKIFRSHLISKLGAYSLDNPGKELSYSEVFPDLIKVLKESFRSDQKSYIQSIAKNIVFYESILAGNHHLSPNTLSENEKAQIDQILNLLIKKYHYTQNGAITLLKYVIKERY